MLKYLPHSGMDFLQHFFNRSWSLYFFPSFWKTSSVIPIYKMGKLLDCPAFFRPISLTSCVSKLFCFYRIILSRLTPFSFPVRPVSVLDDLLSIKFYFILSSFRVSLTNPTLALGDSRYYRLLQSFSLCLAPRPFSQNYFSWPPSLLCSLDSIFRC